MKTIFLKLKPCSPKIAIKLSRAHKKRLYLKNLYLYLRSNQKKKNYTKQRNILCVFTKENQKNHHANLNRKDIADNKQF